MAKPPAQRPYAENMRHWQIAKAEPTGTRRAAGFVTRADSCGPESFDVDEYPESVDGLKLHNLRIAHGKTIGDIGRRFGISPEVVSGLECGRYTMPAERWRDFLLEVRRG